MYGGVKSFKNAPRVESYEQAAAVLHRAQRTPTGKQRTPKFHGYPLGGHSKSVCWVSQDAQDCSIAFTLYDTAVVTWWPDNSVEIDNYGSSTTSGFARRFLPDGIHLDYPVNRRGAEGGARTIRYRDADGQSICSGGLVRMVEKDGLWLPDPATLDEMRFVDLDRRAARDVSREYHLGDFESWLSMAPRHLAIEHDCWALEDCAEALRERDFTLAAMFLPTCEPTRAFGLDRKMVDLGIRVRGGAIITMASLAKLKIALWNEAGAFTTMSTRTLSCREYERRMRRVRQLRSICGDGWDLGPVR